MRRLLEIAGTILALAVTGPWILLALLLASDMDSDCLDSGAADAGILVAVAGGVVAASAAVALVPWKGRRFVAPLLALFVGLLAVWYLISRTCGPG